MLTETIISVPDGHDLAAIHKTLYRELVPRKTTRSFVFCPLGTTPEGDALVLVRGEDLPRGEPRETPHSGSQLTVTLSAQVSFKSHGRHITPPPGDTQGRRKWLERRADSGGFRLLDVMEVAHEVVRIRDNKRNCLIPVTTFTGQIEVIDPDAFTNTLTTGLGRGRAWGLGTMVIHP